MKKHFILLAIAALLSTAFVACDPKEDNPDQPSNKPVLAQVEFGGSLSDAISPYYSLTATYEIKSAHGIHSSTNDPIYETQEFKDLQCPCTITLHFKYKQRAAIPENETYNLQFSTFLHISTPHDNYQHDPVAEHTDIASSDLADLVDLINTGLHNYNITIDKDGKITSAKAF